MSVAVITGSCGLIGSQTVAHYCRLGFDVVGIDNDMRGVLFGPEASTARVRPELEAQFPAYRHVDADIRDRAAIERVFSSCARDIQLVVHTAAQPSHDWAARDPHTDFSINAAGTLVLLECSRLHAPDAVFIFTSTNKVYGDTPNRLPLVEQGARWEIDSSHPFFSGIDETMSIDATTHSLFGASKVAADVLVQEYGRYFGMKTACFRGGCLTGPGHSGTMLHGFLSYLMKCLLTDQPYTVFGYKAKQVRDNIHSADVISAFHEFFLAPRAGEVYNLGGGRACHCSMLEAIEACEAVSGRTLTWQYDETPRMGDHMWYVSDCRKLMSHYPNWRVRYGLTDLIRDIHDQNIDRWASQPTT